MVDIVHAPLRDRLLWGLRWGTFYAVVLSAWVLFLYVVKGSAPFDRQGVTLWSALLLYLATGPMGGLVVGAFLPLVRWQLGSVVTGILSAFPVGVGAALAVVNEPAWSRAHTFVACMISLVGGGMAGLVFRGLFYREAQFRG